ncbi:type 1 glutamine amidotransferase domain-containing protein [Flagellimonas sp. HMM57]|uniref:type 1 glutamine amidotransferase domain-containing protein n=1 Tax=unclassified Flagellimonas TaxID=2644544 RepID=UPI0013D5ED7D|nr:MULTISPECIES: type 1 glutamine amidotransferase domain-containing protein [unclassified Flagellimonas]UII76763.1 type 1 glutamine amidotransferase domain-containing protein [Flagellimonas sp. HMM57]
MKNTFLLICLLSVVIGCNSKTAKEEKSSDPEEVQSTTPQKDSILFIVSNQHTYGDTDINASNHFAEIVLAFDVLKKEGYVIDFVSPEGGAIPIGYLNTSDSIQKKYLYDFEFMNLLKHTKKPEEVEASNYMAVYYGGGGAAMFGVPENKAIQKITLEIYEKNNGIVAAICHGTAGLVNLKTSDGKFIYEGKKINGFPDLFENMDAEYYKQFPFSIEQTIKTRGGDFVYSKEGWDNYSIADGKLITGQDPTAAASVATKISNALKDSIK